jgi:hypothetical protein
MTDEKQRDPPAQPPTVKFDAPPPWAIELSMNVNQGFRAVNVRLDTLEGSDKSIADEVSRLRRDVVDVRSENVRHDEEIRRLSTRAKVMIERGSDADMAIESQLMQERTAREALATSHAMTSERVAATAEKVDALDLKQDQQLKNQEASFAILARLDKVASNPLVKTLAAMIMTAVITWLATHGVRVPQ